MSEKKRHKIMIGIEVVLLCMIIATLSINAASMSPPSNGVSYNKNNQVTVQNALDDLYTKANYGNATASQILKGRTALVGGKQITGTYVAPTLVSQTPGDAKPENIDEGKIAWVNGEKIVGSKRVPLAQMFELGDYISYTTIQSVFKTSSGILESYVFSEINPKELNLWRVIRKNEAGTVDIVSEYVSSSTGRFKSGIGYMRYIEILNSIAKHYETEGITVGSRHMGYDGKAKETLASVPDAGVPDEGFVMDKNLVENAIGTLTAKKVDQLENSNSGYFVASRGGRGYTGSGSEWMTSDYEWCLRHINGDGVIIAVCRFGNPGRGNGPYSFGGSSFAGPSLSVRPIVTLKSDLKITGGDGTRQSPYTLGI